MPTKNTKTSSATKKLPTLQASFTPPKFQTRSLHNTNSTDSAGSVSEISQAEKEMGQLSLDVYDSPSELIIIAPIAGVKLEDINLSITEDVLTVHGKRHLQFLAPGDSRRADIIDASASDDYLIQECFWGEFSRSIVLPDHVDSGKISASFKDGILRISIPKTPGGDSKTKLIKIKSS